MRPTDVNLTKKQKVELEYNRNSTRDQFMQKRYQDILLKSESRSSESIAEEQSTTEFTVNCWFN